MSCTKCYQNTLLVGCSVCHRCLDFHDEKKIQSATQCVEYYRQEHKTALDNTTASNTRLSDARQIMLSEPESPEFKRRCDLCNLLQDINYMWQSRLVELTANLQYAEGRLRTMECENVAVEERKKTK
jgi:hypothetical protein